MKQDGEGQRGKSAIEVSAGSLRLSAQDKSATDIYGALDERASPISEITMATSIKIVKSPIAVFRGLLKPAQLFGANLGLALRLGWRWLSPDTVFRNLQLAVIFRLRRVGGVAGMRCLAEIGYYQFRRVTWVFLHVTPSRCECRCCFVFELGEDSF